MEGVNGFRYCTSKKKTIRMIRGRSVAQRGLRSIVSLTFASLNFLEGGFLGRKNFLVLLRGELVSFGLVELGDSAPASLAGIGDANFLLNF